MVVTFVVEFQRFLSRTAQMVVVTIRTGGLHRIGGTGGMETIRHTIIFFASALGFMLGLVV